MRRKDCWDDYREKKFAKVCEWFEARGITVTDTIKQMIYNAWLELNNQMIELGLKEASTADDSGGSTAEDDGSTADDVFTDTDQAVQIE